MGSRLAAILKSIALGALAGNLGLTGPATIAAAEQPATVGPRTISGVAEAADGDTVVIREQFIDLWGVEAPSLANSDGWIARAALDRFIGEGGQLVCIIKTVKTDGRDRAICSSSQVGDIGRAMLSNGWAVVNRYDRKDLNADVALAGVYRRAERRAYQSRVGLWGRYPLN